MTESIDTSQGRPVLPPDDSAFVQAGGQQKETKGMRESAAGIQKSQDTAVARRIEEKKLQKTDTMQRIVKSDIKKTLDAGEATKSSESPELAKSASVGGDVKMQQVREWVSAYNVSQLYVIMSKILDVLKDSKISAGKQSIQQGIELLKLAKESSGMTKQSYYYQAMEKFTEGMTQFMNAGASAYQAVSTAASTGKAGQEADQQLRQRADALYDRLGGYEPAPGAAAAGPAPMGPLMERRYGIEDLRTLAAAVPDEVGPTSVIRDELKNTIVNYDRAKQDRITNLNQEISAKHQAFSGAINGINNIIQGTIKGDVGRVESEKQMIEGYRNASEGYKQNFSKVEQEQADAIKGLLDFIGRFVEQTGRSTQWRS